MEKGLTTIEAEKRIKEFGQNEILIKEINPPLKIFLSQFPNLINMILATASLFSFVINDFLDGFFILAVLLINGVFGFIQEYRAEKSLEKLKSFIKLMSRVIRDGKEVQIETAKIVPEDMVILSEGERIPADGKLILGRHVEIDESILTGESLPLIKKENDLVFKGTLVVKGKGYLLVEKIGMTTRFGQIANSLSNIKANKTPLQIQLNGLGRILSTVIVFFSLLLILIGISQGKLILPLILLAVSIAIAAIPEGLPAVVTIALAIGTNRMAKKQVIVRKMPSIETLGSMQIILVDKTGTLTENSMRVKKTWIKNEKFLPEIMRCCILGNTASLIQKEETKEFDIVGSKTDGALLLWAKTQSKDIDLFQKEGRVIDEYVFDPATKTITTVWQKENKNYVFVRGAPETILEKSNLNKIEKEKITKLYEDFAREGLRVIGFGTKLEANKNYKERDDLEKNLEFLGFTGIYDPPRKEAKQAVLDAKNAGIRTIMVTGDNELTALAIAKEVGFIEKDEDVVTGEEFDKITDQDLEKIILKTRIFARTKPEDKLRLVTLFKKMGYVVGVTGDGVNDALALKKADVGVAMGEKGTDVAKEASDIILVKDDFSTLVHAILEGRTIYDNILKAITYLLSGNLAELSLVFCAVLLNLPSPLLPTQILWINLVTDVFPAIALASDNKDYGLLKKSPRDPKTPILTKNRLFLIAIIGFGLAFSLLVLFRILLNSSSVEFSRTIIFNLLVFSHMLIALFIRGRSLLDTNKFLAITIVGTVFLQLLITSVPLLQEVFHLGF